MFSAIILLTQFVAPVFYDTFHDVVFEYYGQDTKAHRIVSAILLHVLLFFVVALLLILGWAFIAAIGELDAEVNQTK